MGILIKIDICNRDVLVVVIFVFLFINFKVSDILNY